MPNGFHHHSRICYSTVDRPLSRAAESRPSSRASSRTSRSSLATGGLDRSSIPQRPMSRASISGRATPMIDKYSDHHRDYSGRDRRSIGEDCTTYGLTGRRNTLNAGGSAIPLPTRKSYGGGGRKTGLNVENGLGFSGSSGGGLRRPKKLSGVGEKS